VIGDRELADALSRASHAAGYPEAMKLAAECLEARAVRVHVPFVRIARLLAHAEEKERALDYLEKAFRAKESPLVHLRVGWDWDGLRGHPRFRSLLGGMNLPEI